MRVAVVAGSLATGIRVAEEIQDLPGVGVFVIACNAGKRPTLLRWAREILLLAKLRGQWTLANLWSYIKSHRLVVLSKALDDPGSVNLLRSLQCDVGLHAANVIYREPVISAFRLGILNAHIGILPSYRGRSVAEWSVLQGDRTGVTVFFIDSGIDTGARIVLREYIPLNGAKAVPELKNQLFACDARLYRMALERLISGKFQFGNNDVAKGRRYYVMSKLFTSVVDQILSGRRNS